MARPLSLQQLVDILAAKVLNRFQREEAAVASNKVYVRKNALFKYKLWTASVLTIPMDAIERAIAVGGRIKVPYDGREHLASDLRLVHESLIAKACERDEKRHDKEKTTIDWHALWSLFPEMEYEKMREKAVILGKGDRTEVWSCAPDQYLLLDKIHKTNNEVQNAAYAEYVADARMRKRLEKKTHAKNTDDMMIKLGVWKK
jgi:hypothetical protein